jgi:hypothetical protein
MRSYICVQVVPASTGAQAGLGGGFMIAGGPRNAVSGLGG